MAFEHYKNTGRYKRGGQYCTLGRRHNLYISEEAMREHDLRSTCHMEGYYDPATHRIGLKPVPHTSDTSLLLSLSGRGSGGTISLRGFCKQYGIPNGVARKYDFVWDNARGLFIIDLALPVTKP